MDTAAYHLRDLRVERAGRCVLDIPALHLASGRVTAIVGPNGAGKTTLLHVLALLLAPTSGSVELRGHALVHRERELVGQRRQVTLVAQAPLLFRRSVRANLTYGLRQQGLEADWRVDTALAAVGLVGFAERPAWKLSGGEAQRVAIARALALDPPVYLFDEPTANVDRQHVATIESLLGALGARGKTVILTTHNLEQAYRLSESVVCLVEGRLAPFPLVNLLRGVTEREGDITYFRSANLRIEIPSDATGNVIAIDPDNIIVSREPLRSSARNCFPGCISKVEYDERGVAITVDCGRPLMAHVTRHSYEDLSFNVGTAVYVTFKSSAIHVL